MAAVTATRGCTDPVILNQWHAVAELDEVRRGALHTLLLDEPLTCWMDERGAVRAETRSNGAARPQLLPLDPRAETPIRADRSAIAYRRWLSRLGVTYGVIPA